MIDAGAAVKNDVYIVSPYFYTALNDTHKRKLPSKEPQRGQALYAAALKTIPKARTIST